MPTGPNAALLQKIFEDNELQDLKDSLEKRHCLNRCNTALVYLFHFVQSAGILTTTIATGIGRTDLIWVGVGLNVTASLLNMYEKTNANLSKKLLDTIHEIKKGTYVDEGVVMEVKSTDSPNEKNRISHTP